MDTSTPSHAPPASRAGLGFLEPGASVALIFLIALVVSSVVLEQPPRPIALLVGVLVASAAGRAAAGRWGASSRVFVLGATLVAVAAGISVAVLAG